MTKGSKASLPQTASNMLSESTKFSRRRVFCGNSSNLGDDTNQTFGLPLMLCFTKAIERKRVRPCLVGTLDTVQKGGNCGERPQHIRTRRTKLKGERRYFTQILLYLLSNFLHPTDSAIVGNVVLDSFRGWMVLTTQLLLLCG
mmetsp:Transcript_40674/g.60286  ORF Transcript_40674/g.60286 Transcript_40674/m.60286 type:complete len:143 (+) Transcript_40674:249-677(+)